MAKNRLGDIFISLFNKGLYVSKDEGKTFNKVSDFYPWNLTFHPNLDYGWGSNCMTSDNGKTWKKIVSSYLTIDSLNNVIIIDNFSSPSKGIYSDIYYGNIITNKSTKLSSLGIDTTVKFNNIRTAPNGYVYLATNGDGLYRSRQKYVSVKEEPALTSNYLISPNPASDYINIDLSFLRKQESMVEIFNIFGEKISTSADLSPALSVGEGVRKIDISNLPTGVYFIKIGNKFEKFVKM